MVRGQNVEKAKLCHGIFRNAVDREDCGRLQYPSLLASATLRRK
jgi:hypothetical protein